MIKLILADVVPVLYYCLADEIGLDTQTYHTHIYIVCSTPVRFSRWKNLFPMAHIEKARGTSQENRDYVTKAGRWENSKKSETSVPGTFEEYGKMPIEKQGSRSDIARLYEMIADGFTDAEIMEENPSLARYINLFAKVRQSVLESRYHNTVRDIKVTYIFGPTGVGKTKQVYKSFGYHNVYRCVDYKNPFDAYQGQDVLCLDEFRSELPIGLMLNILDIYPLALPARYSDREACYTNVYIISNWDLKVQYPDIQQISSETWRAFLRRIHQVIEYRQDGTVIDHGSAWDYIYPNVWIGT